MRPCSMPASVRHAAGVATSGNVARHRLLWRLLPCLLALAGAAYGSAGAQELYRISWTMQDPTRGLRQALAEQVIGRANDWFTRNDPNAPTAREDDLLRITVVGQIEGSTIHTRLCRLVLGGIAIDSNFTDFIDSALLARLVCRDYFWRDEVVQVFNPTATAGIAYLRDNDAGQPAIAAAEQTGPDADEILGVHLDESVYGWAGVGFDQLAQPGFSAGRARIGLATREIRAWAEVPAPIGSRTGPLSRGFEAAYGVGASFEQMGIGRWLAGIGGMVSVANASQTIGTAAAPDGERYILSKAALLYAIFEPPFAVVNGTDLRVKLGVGYSESTPLPAEAAGSSTAAGPAVGSLKASMLAELRWSSLGGVTTRTINLGTFGASMHAMWHEQFSSAFGLRASVAVHGVLGTRDRALPPVAFFITPVFTLQ